MRYPVNAPVTKWMKFRTKYISNFNIKMPPLGTTSVIITVSMILTAFFAVGIYPKIYHEYFRKEQEKTFSRLNRSHEELAHGQRVWTDPFERSKRT